MHPADEKRLQHERDIARSVCGPDYSSIESAIAKSKAEFAKGQAAQSNAERKRRFALTIAEIGDW